VQLGKERETAWTQKLPWNALYNFHYRQCMAKRQSGWKDEGLPWRLMVICFQYFSRPNFVSHNKSPALSILSTTSQASCCPFSNSHLGFSGNPGTDHGWDRAGQLHCIVNSIGLIREKLWKSNSDSFAPAGRIWIDSRSNDFSKQHKRLS
jgi:hypothetical protein